VVDLNKILGIDSFNIESVLKQEPDFLKDQDHKHDDSIKSFGHTFEGHFYNYEFNEFINELIKTKSNDLFRYKGVISFKGLKKKVIF